MITRAIGRGCLVVIVPTQFQKRNLSLEGETASFSGRVALVLLGQNILSPNIDASAGVMVMALSRVIAIETLNEGPMV